jgi:hypothetical protein
MSFQAQKEGIVFPGFFADLPDPWRSSIRFRDPPVVPASGVAGRGELRRKFGEKKIELLRRFLPFKDGPLARSLGDIFATLDATMSQQSRPWDRFTERFSGGAPRCTAEPFNDSSRSPKCLRVASIASLSLAQ